MAQSLEKVNSDTINVAAIIGTGNSVQANSINIIGKKTTKYIQIIPPPSAKPLPELWKVPCKNWNFIGRSKFLKQIENYFNKESDPVILTACHGLGGIGKTQVALEFVWKYYKQYNGVVWFNAENKGQLQLNYINLGIELNIISDEKNILMEEKVHYVKHWLEDTSRAGWLLIYDNAVSYKDIGDLIPTKGGKVLITSRYTAGWPQVSISVDVFTLKESIDYIQKVLGDLILESDEAQVEKLAETLGRLPLALAQASAYIKTNRLRISRFLEIYERRKMDLLSDKTLSDETLPPDSNRASVFITWDITMDAVSSESLLAARWLKICSCLASDDIPNFLIEEFANIKENNPSLEIFEKAHGTLSKYSMLALNDKSQSASIHRLVQEVIQLKWGREEKENIVINTFQLLKKCFPYGSETLKDYDTKRQLFPHLEAFLRCLEVWKQEMPTDESKTEIEKIYFVNMLFSMAQTCLDLGYIDKGRELLERALPINEKHYGPDHPEVAINLTHLGNAYRELGNGQKARELLERVLTIKEKHYGPDHPGVASTLMSLGCAYGALGNTLKASELLERALPMNEKHCGPDHPGVARILTNLGSAYVLLGNTHKARELLERALPMNEKHYGPNHPEVAITLTNLGIAYGALGNAQKARELLERALPINEKHYGPDHPQVANILTNLGDVYRVLGNAQKACELLERALPIYENHYCPDHPGVAATLTNLGCTYGALGYAQKARELLERALPMDEKNYGSDHPQVAKILTNLGSAYVLLGNAQKARELYELALPMNEKHYYPDHPEVGITLTNLGDVYRQLGNAHKACELLERALPINEKHYGPDCTIVAITLTNLGSAYVLLGNAQKACELYERALPINEKYYGPDHPEVAKILTNLGDVYRQLGSAHKACELLERALPMNEKNYGPDHPEMA